MDDGELVRVLKDGYWERTAVVRKPDGELRVRKESRGSDADSRPWARRSLVREIHYLRTLPMAAAAMFPEFRESWGEENATGPVGYEMAYLDGWTDLGTLVQSGRHDFDERQIAEAVIGTLHEENAPDGALSTHVADVAELVFRELAQDREFEALVDADQVVINGEKLPGLRRSFDAVRECGLLSQFDTGPQVRLHGDLILENIIVPPDGGNRFLFIDPVSVAGVTVGHPTFDLVKYMTYATGSLYSIRSGSMVGRALSPGEYAFGLEATTDADRNFRDAGLGEAFQSFYIERYGDPDIDMVNLLDVYFSLAMAINTTGTQPLTRALKAALTLAAMM